VLRWVAIEDDLSAKSAGWAIPDGKAMVDLRKLMAESLIT
jgi:hypothetical protein